MPIQTAIYARLSLVRDGNDLSVDRQVDLMEQTLAREGFSEPSHVFTDRGYSASKRLVRRPAMERLVSLIQSGDLDNGVLAVYSDDRLDRTVAKGAAMLDLLYDHRVRLLTKDGWMSVETDDPMTGFRLVMAAGESRKISERTKVASRATAREGRLWGGKAGWGYKVHYDNRKRPVATIDEEAATIIREVYSRLIKGESLASVCRDLTARGIPSPGNTTWKSSGLKATMIRPALAGIRVHTERDRSGRAVKTETYEAQWEPILTKDEHARLCVFLSNGRAWTPDTGLRYWLSGMLISDCGRKMRINNVNGVLWYTCRDRCTAVRRTEIEPLIEDHVLAFLRQEDDEEPEPDLSELVRLQGKLTELTDAFARGQISAELLGTLERNVKTEIARVTPKEDRTRRAQPEDWPQMAPAERQDALKAYPCHIKEIHIKRVGRGSRATTADRIVIVPTWGAPMDWGQMREQLGVE